MLTGNRNAFSAMLGVLMAYSLSFQQNCTTERTSVYVASYDSPAATKI